MCIRDSYYLAWKNNDGYSSTSPATLWVSPVAFDADGAQLVGSTSALITQNRMWETTIEQPDMVLLGGRWLLFFSGGLWETSGYSIAYANCQGPVGPCADPNMTPVFASAGAVAGPGAPSIFTDTSGSLWMAYNAWTAGDVGYPNGARSLRMDPLCLVEGTPVLLGPSATTPQPLTCLLYTSRGGEQGKRSRGTPLGVTFAHNQHTVVGLIEESVDLRRLGEQVDPALRPERSVQRAVGGDSRHPVLVTARAPTVVPRHHD